ncbi:MAG: helix-turn-helix domain-containing protein [Planctomycetota bacterium]|nr:helix-turn-helix domain-containing protein [Planctomycetota bacterium]
MGESSRPIWVEALLSPEMSAVEYRVWSYLSWRQGGNGSAWPSQQTIARALGLSVQGVRGITRRLARKGWLAVHAAGAVGRGHSLCYEVTAPIEKVNGDIPLKPTEKVNGGTPFEPEKVNGDAPKRSTGVDPNTIQITPTEVLTTRTHARDGIAFDRSEGRFTGLNGEVDKWQRTYRGIDVPAEIQRAEAWVTANPRKVKRNWERFLTNWLSKEDKDARNARQRNGHRPSFAAQVSAVGERIEV